MDEQAHPDLPWPGFSPERSLVLPLQAARMATPFGETCEVDGVWLERKSEFHVTVLSQDMSRAAAALGEARLRALYESRPWTPHRTGRYALLRQSEPTAGGARECWSLIEHLELSAMRHFRGELARMLGSAFADPVPHVTHFVHGDPNGIGVPDTRALQALQRREVLP